ncbi:MAG: SRPBCC family protein [Sphingomonas sp.]|uniref:SRPBCC family protein n=1 Tax=Sphingomonas sp. TaxID=28214 RepID=UPI001B2F4483|nr:SRPBCC family protein [Sphingomonas sp.]MBO9622060.1 SRPBCC family protein [Sphingomonas sp.]
MAAIFKSVIVPASADRAWALVSRFDDPAALAPGFVSACEIVEGDRVVHFADGGSVREMLVSCDDAHRRLSYAAVGGKSKFHHASMQVVPLDAESSRIDWVTDLLPDELAPFIDARMEAGTAAIERGLSG